jgi:hypothetical protein
VVMEDPYNTAEPICQERNAHMGVTVNPDPLSYAYLC